MQNRPLLTCFFVIFNCYSVDFTEFFSLVYFYSRSDNLHRENHIEIDFLIANGKKISPIEVKSASYRSHASLDKFLRKFSAKTGTPYILYPKDVAEKDGILHLPLYMAMCL